jgi:hypothetical protein
MFTTKTAFILGAGASWHYGYPTGEQLVKKIIEKAAYASAYFEFSAQHSNHLRPECLVEMASPDVPLQQQWTGVLQQCELLKAGLQQVNPLVIDYFLGWNPKVSVIGLLLIAWVILECEHNQLLNRGNLNRRETLTNSPFEAERIKANTVDLKKYKDDWCRFVIHQLAINCKSSSDLFKNDITFITFNYDISLERAIYQGLRHIELFRSEDIEKFLSGGRILHVYGKVRENFAAHPPRLKWNEQGRNPKDLIDNARSQHLSDYKNFLDQIYLASRGIRVIDPEDKDTDKETTRASVEAIKGASSLYILGYGFDQNNSDRLNLQYLLHRQQLRDKHVFFTNFGNVNRVNKRASVLFFGDTQHFLPSGSQVEAVTNNFYYERSFRDVYEALELDFD